jgi:anti-sigma B factor antagonist
MEMNVTRRDKALVLQLAGEVTIDNAQELKEETRRLIESMAENFLILDLAEVPFIDSSGIGFLIVLKSRCEEKGKTLALFRPSSQAERILSLVQLDSFLRLAKDEAELGKLIGA